MQNAVIEAREHLRSTESSSTLTTGVLDKIFDVSRVLEGKARDDREAIKFRGEPDQGVAALNTMEIRIASHSRKAAEKDDMLKDSESKLRFLETNVHENLDHQILLDKRMSDQVEERDKAILECNKIRSKLARAEERVQKADEAMEDAYREVDEMRGQYSHINIYRANLLLALPRTNGWNKSRMMRT